jgi:hypothetical protein
MKFGEPITNICAGFDNPRRHSYFVSSKKYIKCTDKKGKFWETDKKVIVSGHISYEECEELYAPIWEEEFGRKE